MVKKCSECSIDLKEGEVKEVAFTVGYFCASCAKKISDSNDNKKWWNVDIKEY